MNENEKNENVTEEAYEEEKIDIDLSSGPKQHFFVANNGSLFGVSFDKLFEQPQLSIYNTFEMSSKRNFKGLCAQILETYKELFLDENEELKEECQYIFFQILRIKSEIMVSEGTPYDKFIGYLEEIIEGGDGLLKSIINDFVEKHYSLSLDEATANTKASKRKVNSELQVSDEQAKELLKIAYLYRVVIPIVSIYFYYNKGTFSASAAANGSQEENDEKETLQIEEQDEMEFNEVNSSIFAYLFNKFSKNPEALRNKLYRLAQSGISKTSYSDKRFWLVAKNVAITEQTETLEIYKKLLTNAIPKLSIDADKNIVSFLQSVINNQVDFLFQNKFKYRFIPLGNNETGKGTEENDESMTEYERVEIQQSRKDEGEYILRKLNISTILEKICEKMNVGVSDSEVKDLMTYIKRNPIQEEIIALLTFKYFNDKDALKFVSFYQYCYLLIACKKFLLNQKYIYLPLILTSFCEKHRERVNIAGKKVKPEILASKKYKELIEEKYKNFAEEVEKPFVSIIATVYSSVFKDRNGEEIFDSTVKVGKIAEEIVNLSRLV